MPHDMKHEQSILCIQAFPTFILTYPTCPTYHASFFPLPFFLPHPYPPLSGVTFLGDSHPCLVILTLLPSYNALPSLGRHGFVCVCGMGRVWTSPLCVAWVNLTFALLWEGS